MTYRLRWLALGLVAATVVATIGWLLFDIRNGLDLSDEGLYLLAAHNHQPLAAYNGWSGRYTGLLFAMVDYDIARFRVLGIELLALAGAVLGGEVATFLERSEGGPLAKPIRGILVTAGAGTVLGFYVTFLRTPSYNWMALVAVVLAAAGMMGLLALDPRSASAAWSGLLLGVGIFAGLMAKVPVGLGLIVLAPAVAVLVGGWSKGLRAPALAISMATVAVLLGMHFWLVADPAQTIRAIQRSASHLAVIDPSYYQPASAILLAVRDALTIPLRVLLRSDGLILLGLAPLVPSLRQRLGARWTIALGVGPVLIVGLALTAIEGVRGHAGGWRQISEYALACLATAFLATAGILIVRRGMPRRPSIRFGRRLALAALALVAEGAAYAFGSNNGLVTQLGGAAGLILIAGALLAGSPFRGAVRASVVAAVLGVASFATWAAIVAGHADPYRVPPLETATVSVTLPRLSGLQFDPATAAYWSDLASATYASGWTASTPLLDLTWSPAIAYALDATVPDTLTARVGREETATAASIEAIRLSRDIDWRSAWVVTSADLAMTSPEDVLASVGRSFPQDYELVARLTVPVSGLHQEIWRPILH